MKNKNLLKGAKDVKGGKLAGPEGEPRPGAGAPKPGAEGAHFTEKEFFELAGQAGAPALPGGIPVQASAGVLFRFTGLDDAGLRRLEGKLDGAGLPYIPKAVLGKWLSAETIAGVNRYLHELARAGSVLPASYDSMRALENSPLGIPAQFTKWALKNGCGGAALGGSRIDAGPILKKLMEVARKIAAGVVTGIDGLEEWDTAKELAQKLREERLALQRKALVDEGNLLVTRDGSALVTKLVAEGLMWEKLYGPYKSRLLNLPKSLKQQVRTIYNGEGSLEEKGRRAGVMIDGCFAAALDWLRGKIPKPMAGEPEGEDD